MKIENTVEIERFAQVARPVEGNAGASSGGWASFESLLDSQTDAFLTPLLKEFEKASSGAVSTLSSPTDKEIQGMGELQAEGLVKLLDKTGFLDKMVNSIVASSGKANWVSDSMRYDLKVELGKRLEEMFSQMDWSEAMQFIMELKLKLTQEALGPMPFEPNEERPKTVYNEIEQTMQKQIEQLAAFLK